MKTVYYICWFIRQSFYCLIKSSQIRKLSYIQWINGKPVIMCLLLIYCWGSKGSGSDSSSGMEAYTAFFSLCSHHDNVHCVWSTNTTQFQVVTAQNSKNKSKAVNKLQSAFLAEPCLTVSSQPVLLLSLEEPGAFTFSSNCLFTITFKLNLKQNLILL